METTPTNPRAVNTANLVDGSILRWDLADGEFKANVPGTLPAIPDAITGGESPTEAEFLALRTALVQTHAVLVASGLAKAAV